MQSALMWLNLYGCQAVRHQCPSHKFILQTQGQISWNFAKKYWKLADLKISVFSSRPFWFLFSKKYFFASSPWKSDQIYRVEQMGQNFKRMLLAKMVFEFLRGVLGSAKVLKEDFLKKPFRDLKNYFCSCMNPTKVWKGNLEMASLFPI